MRCCSIRGSIPTCFPWRARCEKRPTILPVRVVAVSVAGRVCRVHWCASRDNCGRQELRRVESMRAPQAVGSREKRKNGSTLAKRRCNPNLPQLSYRRSAWRAATASIVLPTVRYFLILPGSFTRHRRSTSLSSSLAGRMSSAIQ
jgi:hypothetical protein